MQIEPRFVPPLDPGFVPAVLWNRAYRVRCAETAAARPFGLAVRRTDGTVSVWRGQHLPHTTRNARLNLTFADRLLKFLLWQKGGHHVCVLAEPKLAADLKAVYSPSGARAFDCRFMGKDAYGKPFRIEHASPDEFPSEHESGAALGRHLDGCRIGFDLGGSDRKAAALIDGKVVFSEEVRWDPYFHPDPQYHFDGILDTLLRAAKHLPRVDAVGGSAAGIYVNNEVRIASLFRGVKDKSEKVFTARVRPMFREIREILAKKWRNESLPFEVANDGEVTALMASMSMKDNAVLGIAMGTSVAAGYVTPPGNITNWLNELAFVPVDYSGRAETRDEWSGDLGCAVQFFSQQGVDRLLRRSGIELPAGMAVPERLVEVQNLVKRGDARAERIYETLGVCFGYTIAHLAEMYDFSFRNLLILGRVTSGKGGDLLLETAAKVVKDEFPELHGRVVFRTPNEHDKRHGQAAAAASLPALAGPSRRGATRHSKPQST